VLSLAFAATTLVSVWNSCFMGVITQIKKKTVLYYCLLAVFFVFAFFLCWFMTMHQLSSWLGPGGSLSNELYLPAIMMNAGHGLTVTDTHAVPELRAFLDYEATSFDVACLPEDIVVLPPQPVNLYHKSLIHVVALTWHLCGISWDAVKITLVVFFFLSALLVFFISRLALPTVWSCLVMLAFISNEAVLNALLTLRDFSKAPFILAVVLLLGLAIKKRLVKRQYLLVALGIGCCLGIGMGFRRDMQALAPLAVIMLMTCRLRPTKHAIVTKLVAAILLLSAFLVTGWPALSALYPERYLNAHDLIMGFSSNADAETGLIRPASYEKHYLLDDYYVTLQASSAAYRGFSMTREAFLDSSEQMAVHEREYFIKSAYVQFIAKTFPADMLTRSYAAVLRTVTGVRTNKFWVFGVVEKLSLLFLLIALLIIAAASPYRAWQLVLFLCFFCGYTSLQYSQRHAFHMSFTAYFFSAFVLHHIVSGVPQLLRWRSFAYGIRRNWLMAFGWLAVTLLAFVIPLKIAAMIQEKAVFKLHDAYKQAPRKAIPYVTSRWEGETLFVPEDIFPCHDCKINKEAPWARTRVLVARFKPGTAAITPSFAYEWDTPGPELGGTGIVHVESQADAGYLEYYFVVHLTDTCAEWNRFAGLLLPDEQADRLECLYEITDLEKLGGLFHMTIPENREAFVPRQRLQLPWPCSFPEPYNVQTPPHFEQQDKQIKQLLRDGAYDEALALIAPILERRPDSVQFTCLQIEAFLRKGDEEKAHTIIDRLLETYPNDYALYARLDRCFERTGGWAASYANWSRIAAEGNACAEGYIVNKGERIALVHQSQKRYEEALRFYDAVLRKVPEARFSAEQYDRILEMLAENQKRLHFWEELHSTFLEAAVPALHLGKSLELHNRFDEAMNLYRQVEALHPDEAEALLRQGFILAITEAYEKGIVMMQQTLQVSPEIKSDFIHSLEERGRHYKDTGDLVLAEKVYRILMHHEPENIWHQVHCAEALLAQGNYEASRKMFMEAIKHAPDVLWVAHNLEESLMRLEDPDLWMSTWKSLYEMHPEAYIPAFYYGRSLESNAALEVALHYFQDMYEKYPDKPEIALRQGAFVAITDGYENGRSLMDQALALNPDMQREHKKLLERIADHYGNAGKYEIAERVYQDLIQENPEDGWIRVWLAELLLKQGDVEAAKQVFIDILDFAPESPYSAQKLSELLRQAWEMEKELAVWKSLCDRHPDAYVPCAYYAEALETAGFYGESCNSIGGFMKNIQCAGSRTATGGNCTRRLRSWAFVDGQCLTC
jgi:tetratricopeptide (TPR) repeat protein